MKNKPPKLPRELYGSNRTCGEVQERNQERARLMQETYGVPFSYAASNPLGVKQAKAKGVPGSGYPRAIYSHKSLEPVDDPAVIALVEKSFKRWKSVFNFCTFTTTAFDTGLSFQDVLGAVKFMQASDPHRVSIGVDRLGKPTNYNLETNK